MSARRDAGPGRRRRILLVNQHYWPDHASTAQHLADLAEALAEEGHDVHVICSRAGSRPGGPPRARREARRGVTIHRVGATGLGRASTLRRMVDYLSFHQLALARALTLPRFDVVVTLTTPPLIAVVGQALRRLRGTRHVSWSMDLHPDASLALGRMSTRNAAHRALASLSDALYRGADRVVALGPYMADRHQRKGVPNERIATIPVWSRRDEVYPMPRDGHPLRAALGLADKFVVMYSGNHGLAHTFDALLDAARRLKDRDDIVFLFVGDGPRRREVTLARDGAGLDNIRLLDFFPREHLHASLSLADLHVVSLRPEMTGICVPGKLYGAMASGRPVLFIGPPRCEVADTVTEHGCGEVVGPHDGAAAARAITRLADDPELAETRGEAGLAAFVENYEREPCCAAWCWMLDELLDGTVSPDFTSAGETAEEPAARPTARART
jgi:glycosyltransferase involved in cell wall biosynthesis